MGVTWLIKLRVKVKVKFTPQITTKAQRGSRGIALTLSLTSTLDGEGNNIEGGGEGKIDHGH